MQTNTMSAPIASGQFLCTRILSSREPVTRGFYWIGLWVGIALTALLGLATIHLDAKDVLGLLAVVLVLAGFGPVYWGIFYGRVRPHIFTYFIWSVTVGSAFVASWISGGAAGAWALGVAALLITGIFLLCFRHGTKDVTAFDKVALSVSVCSVIPWLLTRDPTISVIMITAIDALAYFPTYRKTWKDPYSEPCVSWIVNSFRYVLIIGALSAFNVSTLAYPIVMVCMNGALAAEILMRRAHLRKAPRLVELGC